jgi:hypothetical protein
MCNIVFEGVFEKNENTNLKKSSLGWGENKRYENEK